MPDTNISSDAVHDTYQGAAEPLLNNDSDEEDQYPLNPLTERQCQPGEEPMRLSRRTGRRKHKITPIFAHIQRHLLELLDLYAPSTLRKSILLAFICVLWFVCFSISVAQGAISRSVAEFGPPKRLSCISSLWPSDERSCGVNGAKCLPFAHETFVFRCPPDCSSVRVLEPSFVGNTLAQYKQWVIGGPRDSQVASDSEFYYRGDSFICAAAIHAGILESSSGGCGLLSLRGERDNFPATERNAVESIAFDSTFPMAFTVKKLEEPPSQCYDLRWTTLVFSVVFTVAISTFTTSPAVFFFSTFTIVFFQVALVSDTPDFEEYLSVLQSAVSRFLPASFVAFAIYRICVREALDDLEAQFEKTILWLGGCWFGALENYTLDQLPLQRLTPRDLSEPGAIIVLLVMIAILIVAVGAQAWAFWKEGRFYKYASLYGILACSLLVLAIVPGMNLRIHHYILALLLLPGTAMQTRLSLLFQGFLTGLFINGVARWGFASILETDLSLSDKGPIGSPLPEFIAPLIHDMNITFTFPAVLDSWDGISMVVNDVERFRWPKEQGVPELSWTRIKDEPLYFRFGFFRLGFTKGRGLLQGDYTVPGTWARNGSWMAFEKNHNL